MKYLYKSESHSIPQRLLFIPLTEVILFPSVVAPLFFNSDEMILILNKLILEHGLVGCVGQQNPTLQDPQPQDLLSIGTVCKILQLVKLPNHGIKVLVEGLSRVFLQNIVREPPYFRADVKEVHEGQGKTALSETLIQSVGTLFRISLSAGKPLSEDLVKTLDRIDHPGRLADLIAITLHLHLKEQQEIFETIDPLERLQKTFTYFSREIRSSPTRLSPLFGSGREVGKSVKDHGPRNFGRGPRESPEEDPNLAEIQELKRAGVSNPVFMFDEVDKIGQDFRGDPAAALLEALDPEQNFSFTDHYLDVPFDLSRVLFITTANALSPIPPPLLDRMEVLHLSGYTEEEKEKIAFQFLIPHQKEENGLKDHSLSFTPEAIYKVIREYTREGGVRNLEREIASLCRKITKEVALGNSPGEVIDEAAVEELLGARKYFREVAQERDRVGVATGLAWTENGGDILFIETSKMKGDKGLILTGSLGEVMKESAQAALSYIRSNAASLHVPENFYQDYDIHIHIPAGATPKDGPSAGITIAAAVLSLLKERPVPHEIALTGELTLSGRILPVGGIKEKILAARRAGVKTVLLPKKNDKNLEEVPDYVKKEMEFVFVEHIQEVFDLTMLS